MRIIADIFDRPGVDFRKRTGQDNVDVLRIQRKLPV